MLLPVPTGQALQAVAPPLLVLGTEPVGQAEQDVMPGPLYVSGEQGVQAAAPAAEEDPGGHTLHAAEDVAPAAAL